MLSLPNRIALLAAIVLLNVSALAGCATQSHAQAKKDAFDRWSQTRAAVMYNLAKQQFETGDLNKASQTIMTAIETKPDDPRHYELAARIAMENGQLERAHILLGEALKHDPNHAEAHYLRGVLMQRWRKYDEALASYDAAYAAKPDEVGSLLAASEMLVKLDRLDEAIDRLDAKLVYFEHNAAIRVALGRMYMLDGQHDAAARALNDAHLLSPDDLMIVEHLIRAELAAGRYASAIDRLQRLLEAGDYADRDDLRMMLADCYMAVERPGEARAIYLTLTRKNPNSVPAWIKLGQAAWIIGDVERLGQAAARVAALDPGRFEGAILMGMAAHLEGRTAQAVAYFDRAAGLDPDNTLPLILRGMTLERSGNAAAAAESYRVALTINPDDARAQQLLARIDWPKTP